jgi:hypothetical protein
VYKGVRLKARHCRWNEGLYAPLARFGFGYSLGGMLSLRVLPLLDFGIGLSDTLAAHLLEHPRRHPAVH